MILPQTLHGTAIYADQLGWFGGFNGTAYIPVPISLEFLLVTGCREHPICTEFCDIPSRSIQCA